MKRLTAAFVCFVFAMLTAAAQDISLNGEWEYGLDRKYSGTAEVPGLALDPTKAGEAPLWYRRSIVLPKGTWTDAVLELKGARFRPKVYVNGSLRSSAEGGMTRTMHRLNGEDIRPDAKICIEIELASLKDVPRKDASYIPEVDQWRSNCSSCLWDDVVLHLYDGSRVERALVAYDSRNKKATLTYRVSGDNAFRASISIKDSGGNNAVSIERPAEKGDNVVSFDCTGLREWSPATPNCYTMTITLVDTDGSTLSEYSQTVGLREFNVNGKHFSLNGKPIGLRGGSVVWHRWVRDEDAREVAFDTSWFDSNIIKRIKDHGGNYLRFHLGVPPERILDLCDRAGLAVQYEWSFFHGLPASCESLVEQFGNWLDVASRHPSVCLIHPYNETDEHELATVWKALDKIVPQYPPLVLEDRDVLHIHRYWWGMSENLGLYYDSYKQFVKPIVVDEFGGVYLDRNGDIGGYPMLPKGMKRWLGTSHTATERLHHQELASGKVGEYWRRLGAAGAGVFPIASSFEDGNNWFIGELSEGNPKPVWNAMTAAWAARSVSMDIWDRDFTPGQKISVPVHLFNECDEYGDLKITYAIRESGGSPISSMTEEYRMKPYSTTVVQQEFIMPDRCGDYVISAELTNPEETVKYDVVSSWEVRVLRAKTSGRLRAARIYIPKQDKELRAMATAQGLKITDIPSDADIMALDASDFSCLDGNVSRQSTKSNQLRKVLDSAISRGASVVMLNAGNRTLGKSYDDNARNLGQVSGSPKLLSAKITHTDLFAGISVNCIETAEPESHIHPARNDSSLWHNLKPEYTRLWNGLRGGLIVPAANIEIEGLSQEAFLAGWAAKGADIEKIRNGDPLYAYEYCGFYRFDSRPDSQEAERSLREQVAFLIEDMPAMALSLPIHTPIRITDLKSGYKSNRGGRATGFYPMAEAGKDLLRNPVMRISFGEMEGSLIISQVITEGRLASGFTSKHKTAPLHYDESAVQFVLNMLDAALEHSHQAGDTIGNASDDGLYRIDTANSSMVFEAVTGKPLKLFTYGSLSNSLATRELTFSGIVPQICYPAYGLTDEESYAVSAVQADGNMTLDLCVTDVSKQRWDGGEMLTVTSRDSFYPFEVRNIFKSYSDEDIIETWTEITNNGRKPVTLTRYMSGTLPVRAGEVWSTTFYGAWADECRVCTEALSRGVKTVRSTQGSRNSQSAHAETIISLDGKPCETSGRAIGAALCWGGNFEMEFFTGDSDFHRFSAGICPDNAAVPLASKSTFRTPALAFSYSDRGTGEISRCFHRWGRRYRLHAGDQERKTVLNSWEGVHLDITEPVIGQMMKDAADLGIEMFVLDDGWFGSKYSRLKPDCSLGDWTEDRTKLPQGLENMARQADSLGIGFGLWIEPEMTNVRSELYEKHPDWVLKAADREPVYGRGGTQMVLDLCNPDVQDFVFNAVDGILERNPGISYLKWDCNMPFKVHGSQYLDNQNLLCTEWWKGFGTVCDRIRAAWPDVTMQLCAAGGGRVNWGVLPWFDEFWTSDNTDALQRIYIQWGNSFFFPAIASGSHVSAVPNKATQRSTSLKYRIDVAMSGRMGLELQPSEMTAAEHEQCRKAIAEYKRIRPIVQFGDLYRLLSPYDNQGAASLMYCTENKDCAVFFWWRLANFQGVHLPRIRMQGLDPERLYRVSELDRYEEESPLVFDGQTFSGRFLMEIGLEMPPKHKVPASLKGEWSSRVLMLEEVGKEANTVNNSKVL